MFIPHSSLSNNHPSLSSLRLSLFPHLKAFVTIKFQKASVETFINQMPALINYPTDITL